jgi:glucose-6-phosphate-specific signal transduction histidine kinase
MTPASPSWIALLQEVLTRALTSKAAFRRLVTLVMVTTTAVAVLLGVVLLCAGKDIGWWSVLAASSIPALRAVRRKPG